MDTNSDEEDAGLQRLLELKAMYNNEKKKLRGFEAGEKPKNHEIQNIITQPIQSHKSPASNSPSPPETVTENDARIKGLRKRDESSQLEAGHLQALMKNVIEINGGSVHLDTIVYHVMQRWPSLHRRDGTPYSTADCKKAVQSNLRNNLTSRSMFEKDEENEGLWKMTDEELSKQGITTVHPLTMVLQTIFEKEDTGLSLDVLLDEVMKNWTIPTPDGILQTKNAIRDNLRITLMTNPRFKADPTKEGYFQLKQRTSAIPPKRKKPEESQQTAISTEDATSITENGGVSGKLGLRARKNNVCSRCGGHVQGGKGRWFRGSDHELLCTKCLGKRAKKNPRETSGSDHDLHNENNENENDNEEEEEEEELQDESNPWIQCDKCHRWIQAKSDNITDLSLYDDENPNHLEYFCPRCRENKSKSDSDTLATRKSSRPRSRPPKAGSPTPNQTSNESGTLAGSTKSAMGVRSSERKRKATETALFEGRTDVKLDQAYAVLVRHLEDEKKIEDQSSPTTKTKKEGENSYSSNSADADRTKNGVKVSKEANTTNGNGVGNINSSGNGNKPSTNSNKQNDAAAAASTAATTARPVKQRRRSDGGENTQLDSFNRYYTSMVEARNAIWAKNQSDYEAQLVRLAEERELLNEKAEYELVQQLESFFRKHCSTPLLSISR